MLRVEQLLADKALLEDKAYGVLAGLAVGDSFGDASRKPDNQLAYGMTTDFNSVAAWSTDDTEFALLTATILADSGGRFSTADVVRGWMEKVVVQEEFPRGGASEIEAARNLRRGLQPPQTGIYNAYAHSDGAAMRTAPIGIVCAGRPEKAAELAAVDACLSHARDGIWGAQAVAVAVSLSMVNAGMDEIFSAVCAIPPPDSWFAHALKRAGEIVNTAGGSVLDAWMPLHDELWCSYKAAVPEAVAQAFGVLLLCPDDFRKGVTLAGNFGRDADTIGAITGAVLGARFGAEAIPSVWREKTRYPTGTCLSFAKGIDLEELAGRLAALAEQ
ncbi:MAG TPA: ADP-ribosylglycohydrolase family protein [Feifaniaceae bacterium]|nr:ADP-ribosylglycohydrolase family protein [Feifaniaceae bacterium]